MNPSRSEQSVTLVRRIEVAVPNGKNTSTVTKESTVLEYCRFEISAVLI